MAQWIGSRGSSGSIGASMVAAPTETLDALIDPHEASSDPLNSHTDSLDPLMTD